MSWTGERVETLKKLWTDGQSASAIAAKLGEVTRNAVIGKVHRLGLAGHKTGARKAATPRTGFPFATRSRRRTPAFTNPFFNARAPPANGPPAPCAHCPNWAPRPKSPSPSPRLTDRLCRWPQGDPKLEGFHFCGRTRTRSAIPYCDHHAAIAYN